MSFIVGAAKVIFLLGFLIFIHEGGHFLVAKLCKVHVKEFAIGFGPKIFSKQGRQTKYSLRLIPLGGFVDMLGETETVDEKGSFSSAKLSHRIAIVAAGALVNIMFGILVYFILMSSSGVNSTTIIKQIIPDYASENMLLQPGDKILKINGKNTRIKSDVDEILYESEGEKLEILVERNGEKLEFQVEPVKFETDSFTRYMLGVEVQMNEKSLANNLYYGFWKTAGFMRSTVSGMAKLFSGKVSVKQMAGPVGISGMVVKTNGIYDFVYMLAIISFSLGFTNLLPIPALDGGKILLLIIEGIRKKKMDEETELKIQSIGFTLLIMLSIYISVNDVSKLF